jgi:MYXO-CTERM domain-containing protein
MKHMNAAARLFFLLVIGMALSGTSFAGYIFSALAPVSGGDSSYAFGINNSGQVVGQTELTLGCCSRTHATIWNEGAGSELKTLGGTNTYAYDINDSGQVAGYSYDLGGSSHTDAIRWEDGKQVYLTALGGSSTAYGINSSGQVAGWSDSGATVWSASGQASYIGGDGSAVDINDAGQVAGNLNGQPTLWNGATSSALGTLGGNYGMTEAINNLGQIVGFSLAGAGGHHAVLWNDTAPIDLGTLGGINSYAHGINDLGQVVGESYTAHDIPAHAFLWVAGDMVDLNDMLDDSVVGDGWVLVSAQDINEKGQIVGGARNNVTGQIVGFLLTPDTVPEPQTLALSLMALVALALVRRRRR